MNCAIRLQFAGVVHESSLLMVVLLVSGHGSRRRVIAGRFAEKSPIRAAVWSPGAKISAKNVDTGLTRDTVTTADGTFVLAELPAGTIR